MPADVKGEVLPEPNVSSDVVSETADTTVEVRKFDVVQYRHKDVLLIVNQINNSEIALCDITNAHDFSFVQFSRAYGFDRGGRTFSVTTTAAASLSEEGEDAPSANPRILDETAAVVMLDQRRRYDAEGIGLKRCETF